MIVQCSYPEHWQIDSKWVVQLIQKFDEFFFLQSDQQKRKTNQKLMRYDLRTSKMKITPKLEAANRSLADTFDDADVWA